MSYEGLTSRERGWLIGASLVFALLNMLAAWLLIGSALYATAFLNQKELEDDSGIARGETIDPNVIMWDVHRVDMTYHALNLNNKATIIILSIGVGFAFLSLGFGLFALGIDGAFKLKATAPGDSQLILQGAAPGLLCFLLAAVVVAIGLTRPQTLEPGSFTPVVARSLGEETSLSPEEVQAAKEKLRQKARENSLTLSGGGNKYLEQLKGMRDEDAK